jgi:spermidine/putrescine transport system ATP-binding protein
MATGRDGGASDYAVELVRVSKRYGSIAALDDLSLQIRHGEFYTLLGPSGCGKTTTLNIIGGFIPVSGGMVRINGRVVQDDPPYRRNVNTVFQNYALFPHMTVAQNIGFGPRMSKVPQAEIDRKVEQVLRLISLPDFGQRRPAELSGGQQQRVALARALVNEPEVLLLDEPLGALDLKIRKQLQAELRNIQRKVGITFVYVTHDQEEAMVMSDRVAVMNRGCLVQEDTPTEIYHHPVNRFVASFIGESNFFEGSPQEVAGDEMWVDIPGFARPVRVQTGGIPAQDQPARPQTVTVMVRPEHVAARLAPDLDQTLDNLAEARVTRVAFLGMYTQIGCELAGGTPVIVHQTSQADAGDALAITPGQTIWVGWQVRHGQVLYQ